MPKKKKTTEEKNEIKKIEELEVKKAVVNEEEIQTKEEKPVEKKPTLQKPDVKIVQPAKLKKQMTTAEYKEFLKSRGMFIKSEE